MQHRSGLQLLLLCQEESCEKGHKKTNDQGSTSSRWAVRPCGTDGVDLKFLTAQLNTSTGQNSNQVHNTQDSSCQTANNLSTDLMLMLNANITGGMMIYSNFYYTLNLEKS